MKLQHWVVGLTVANLALLLFLASQLLAVRAQPAPGVLRGSALEITDALGRVRASISILPPTTGGGQATSETVLLRLINADGQPSVKISSSATDAGLSFVGGDDKSYVVLSAAGPETMLKMVEPNGRQQSISP